MPASFQAIKYIFVGKIMVQKAMLLFSFFLIHCEMALLYGLQEKHTVYLSIDLLIVNLILSLIY